jgi:hypothetical protein
MAGPRGLGEGRVGYEAEGDMLKSAARVEGV